MQGSAEFRLTFRAVVLSALLFGCTKEPEKMETSDVPSPNGRLVVRIEVNESGGAAVPDVTSAYLIVSGSSTAPRELIFKGSAMYSFKVSWQSPETVSLSYTGGYVSTCNAAPVVAPDLKVAVLGCK
jgi:hypothetical protein